MQYILVIFFSLFSPTWGWDSFAKNRGIQLVSNYKLPPSWLIFMVLGGITHTYWRRKVFISFILVTYSNDLLHILRQDLSLNLELAVLSSVAGHWTSRILLSLHLRGIVRLLYTAVSPEGRKPSPELCVMWAHFRLNDFVLGKRRIRGIISKSDQ